MQKPISLEYSSRPKDEQALSFWHKDLPLEKVASVYNPEVTSFLKDFKPEDNFVYALINALSAGEYYSSNRNGDYFPEEVLKKYHHTFVDHGHVYRHHVNKNPEKSLGKVIFSSYNNDMKRVEIVVRLDATNPEVLKIISDILKGDQIKVSMGAKVPFDVCSICANKAKAITDYCDHLKFEMNRVYSDGRKVYAINTIPKFFDISIVTIPADPVARVMVPIGVEKYAHLVSQEKLTANEKSPQTLVIQTEGFSKVASVNTPEAEPLKQSQKLDFLFEENGVILATQERFSDEQILKLAQYPLNEVLSTFLALRVAPVKEDFQKIALACTGNFAAAQELEKRGELFEVTDQTTPFTPSDVSLDFASEKVASEIIDEIYKFSLTKPFLINRILEKTASDDRVQVYPDLTPKDRSYINKLLFDDKGPEPVLSPVKNPIMPMIALGALYAGYAKLFGSTSSNAFEKFIAENPWTAPVITGALAYGITAFQQNEYEKSPLYKENMLDRQERLDALEKRGSFKGFVGRSLLTFPTTYYYSMKAEEKAQRGEPINNVENFVRKNPLPAALGSTLFLGSVVHGIKGSRMFGKPAAGYGKRTTQNPRYFTKTAEYLNQLDNKTINHIFNQLIG